MIAKTHRLALGLAAALMAAAAPRAAIVLTELPAGLRKQSAEIKLAWTGGNDRVHLRASTAPGGGASIAHYDSVHLPSQVAAGSLSFKINPDIPAAYRNTDLRFGVNYCILTDGVQISPEFVILVESNVAPVLTSPANAASIKDLTPTFSWSGSAPFYALLVSDEPFQISDSGTVTGVSAIWQIITPYTSARYGDADPSGINGVSAPPLISGKTYNWLVLNNYANNAAGTSKVAPVPFSFAYAPAAPLPQAQLIEPADADTIPGSDLIKFRWGLVDGAVSYNLEILEENTVDGSVVDVVLWKASSTSGQISLERASGLLRRYRYKWRVYAVGNSGSASLSAKRSFFYAIDVGNLSVDVKNDQGKAVAYAPVKLNRLGGVSSAVFQSGSTDNNGKLTINNAPLGKYEALIENVDGYLAKADTLDHASTAGSTRSITLTTVPGKLLGKVASTATGAGVLNAKVTFTGSDGMRLTAQTNSQGGYSLGLPHGNWQLAASADGYAASAPASASISPTSPSKTVNFDLTPNQYTLSGTVRNSFSQQGIFGATVYLTQAGETRTVNTDGNGAFSFSVAQGAATLRASSAGFAAPETQSLTLDGDKAVVLSLDPNASILAGRTRDGAGTALSKATVSAVPRSGAGRSILSDNQGFFELSLPAGDWVLSASAPGYTPRASHRFLLDASKTVQGVNFILDPDRSVVAGRVTEGGTGLAGVKVSASGASSSALTDNNGYYQLAVNAGTQAIAAAREGYLIPKTYSVPLNTGDTVSGVDFAAVANAGVARGKVIAGGEGVAGARVEAANQATRETFAQISAADGSFTLSLPTGEYVISSVKEGFSLQASASLALPAGGTVSELRVKLAAHQAVLEGTVATGNTPLSSCEVAYQSAADASMAGKTVTDPDGRYSMGLQAGLAYQVTASCPGYQKASAATAALAKDARTALSFNVAAATATFAGKVVDKLGKALAGVKVVVERSGEAVTEQSDFFGDFELFLGTGAYTLTLSKPGYATVTRTLQLSLGRNASAKPDTLPVSVGRMAVRVAAEGAGVEGAFVGLTGLSGGASGGSFTTDADGRLTADNLPVGNYSVTASAEGFSDGKLASVTVSEGKLSSVDVAVVPNRGSLAGTARIGGAAAAGVKVAASGFGVSRGAVTGADGKYLLDRLPAGAYSVTASLPGHAPDKAWEGQALANPGALTGLDFSLTRNAGALSGTVSGAATALGIRIAITGKNGHRAEAACDAAGKYSLPSIPSDVYTVSVTALGYKLSGSTQKPEVTVAAATTLNLTLSPALFTLTGRVLNQIKLGLAGLPVELRSAGAAYRTVSAADGGFAFADVPSGEDYLLAVKPPTADNDARDTVLSVGLDAASVSANLNTLSRRTGISGTVFLDGKAVEGALLRLTGSGNNITALSQPGGEYRIQRVAGSEAALSLTVSKAGAGTLDTAVKVSVVESTEGLALRLKTLKLTLAGVLKSSEGKAISGGKVVLSRGGAADTATAAADGAFAFKDLAANQSVTLATLLDAAKYDNSEAAVLLKEKDDTVALNVTVHATTVTVEVKDQEGALVGDADIVLDGRTAGKTGSDGRYLAANLARGEHVFLAGKSTYRGSAETRLSLSGDTTATLALTVTKVTGGVYGTLTDAGLEVPAGAAAAPAKALPGALVAAMSTQDTLRDTVNSLGQYFIDGIVNGRTYALGAALPGYRALSADITANLTAQTRDLVVQPFPGSAVGRVAGGKAGLRVRLVQVSGAAFRELVTVAGGYFGFTGLQNRGDYAVQVLDGTNSSQWKPFSADAGKALRVDLATDKWGSIEGKIMAGASPVSGALITARDEATGSQAWAQSLADGSYALAGLSSGAYTLNVERSGYRAPGAKVAQVTKGSAVTGVDFSLEESQAGIAGTVVDGSGRGIAALVVLTRGGETLSAQSAEGGQFLFAGLSQGTYSLAVTRAGYASPAPASLAYPGKGVLLHNAVLSIRANRILGVVRDAVTNVPLAQVSVQAGSASAQSDSLGRFEITLASAASPALLEASKPGYIARQGLPVFLDGHGSAVQDLALTADYKFDGAIHVVVKEGKDTLPALQMVLQPFHPDDAVKPSLSAKPTEFAELRYPAPYVIKVKRTGFKDLSKTVDLAGAGPLQVVMAYPTGQILLFATADGKKGKGVDVSLDGKKLPPSAATEGLYESSAKLAPARYEATVKDLDAQVVPLASHFITLGSDSVRTDTLALSFRYRPIADSVIDAPFQVLVRRDDSLRRAPAVTCSLYYRLKGDPLWSALKLDSAAGSSSSRDAFQGELPAQARAGLYEYYFSLRSPQGIRIGVVTPSGAAAATAEAAYSNAQTPALFNLRDPYLLHSIALLPQRLEADTSLYSLSAKDIYQVQMRGENARDLNAHFDARAAAGDTAFTVSWTFANPARAAAAGLSMAPDAKTPRLAAFRGGNQASDSVFQAVCAVRMGAVRLRKTFLIKIQDLAPVSIAIKYVKENRVLEADGAALPLSNKNPSGYAFAAFAATADGRTYNIAPRWSFGADSSAGALTQQGVFIPDSTVARGAALRITDTLAASGGAPKVFTFQANVATFAQVAPAAAGHSVVTNGEGMVLDFNLAGLTKAFTVSMKKPKVSGLLRASPKDEVVGEIIDVELSEGQPFKADSGALMKMPVAKGVARTRWVYLGHWNTDRLLWERVDSVKADSVVPGLVYGFSKYAVIMGSLPLGAYDIVAKPNPFSAHDPYGLQLGYKVSSDVSSQVAVKIEVFNMLGDKVYESIETQLSKGDVVEPGVRRADPASSGRRSTLGPYVWDGRDTKGNLCRNGRYLLKLTVKDGAGKKEYLKKVVMLK